MTDAGLPDDPTTIAAERERWDEDQSVRDRVYETVIQLYEPATADEVAERARCSEGAAREHLEWFAERGIVTVVEGRPKRYRRNQTYFDWKTVRRELRLLERARKDRETVADAPG